MRRKRGMSVEAFRREFERYVALHEKTAVLLGARRYTVSFGLAIPLNETIRQMRGTDEPYDAVLETWFDSGAGLIERSERPDVAEAMTELRELQADLVDLQASSFFFASEELNREL